MLDPLPDSESACIQFEFRMTATGAGEHRVQIGDTIHGVLETGDSASIEDAMGVVGAMAEGLYSYESKESLGIKMGYTYPEIDVKLRIGYPNDADKS